MNFALPSGHYYEELLKASPTLLTHRLTHLSLTLSFDPIWIPLCLFYSSLIPFHRDILSDREISIPFFRKIRIPEKSIMYIIAVYVSTK